MSKPPSETSVIRPTRSAMEIRAWIVNELSRSLNSDPSTIDTAAPLHTLGVDSLAAIGMTGGLAGWLNRDLPATLTWDYATIDAIAEGLADRDAPAKALMRPGIVDFQTQGDQCPIFFFPGLGGHPVSFAGMAKHLGPTHPGYGLTVPGLNGEVKPLTSVEEIAAAMLKNIRLVQAKGPYQLAGYSFGGLLAYETAQQLTAAGETVSMVAIYDTFTPAGRMVRPRWQRLPLHVYLLATQQGRLQYIRERIKRRQELKEAEIAKADPNRPVDSREAIAKNVSKVNGRAAAIYQPKPYAGSVVVFRAMELAIYNIFYKIDATNGWGELTEGRVRVIDLPGSHLSMLGADRAAGAAELLRPYLSGKPTA